MKKIHLLILIIFLGFILRVIFINSSPPSLYGDELTIALDANSILKTAHDQLGNFLPLTFEMGAGRPPGYVYASIPFVAFFGPSVLGVRSLSIVSGIGIMILLYLIGRKIFNERIGLVTAFLAAISPWDISLSRVGFEAHFALFLALLGTFFFLKTKDRGIYYIFSSLCFGLTLHTYPTYKLTLILFLPLLIWYQVDGNLFKKYKTYLIMGVFILLTLGMVSLSQTFIGRSEARFSEINIFSQTKLKDTIEQKINLERKLTKLPENFSKIFHNKPIEYTKVFLENYLQNFSLDFLILHGDRNPRHNMATMGQIYAVEIFLVLIGLLIYWSNFRKTVIFLLLWILISPIASAIIDLPHALRSSFMLPPLILLSALGLITIWQFKNKMLLILVTTLFLIQITFFLQKLYFLAPIEYAKFWSYSAKVASEIALQNKGIYSYIILSDKIDALEFAYPVYAKIDPKLIINQNQNKSELLDLSFKKFDNVYIGNIADDRVESFIQNLSGSVLFIGDSSVKSKLSSYETIGDMDTLEEIVLRKKQN